MTKSKTYKTKGAAAIVTVAVLALIALFGMTACSNAAQPDAGGNSAGTSTPKYTIHFSVRSGLGTFKAAVDGKEIHTGDSVEQGKSIVFTAEPDSGYEVGQWTNGGTVIDEAGTDKTYTHTVTANAFIRVKFKVLPAPFIEGGASLILDPDKLDIRVAVTTADNSPVTVEGCTETTLPSATETTLHAKGIVVILKGKITKLNCGDFDIYGNSNELTDLNVQGLTALQTLECCANQLTALNVQGLTALQTLDCQFNWLTALNVQGLTSLQTLKCCANQLTALNVQGCTALQTLDCQLNRLTALNVQGLTALQELYCLNNRFTELNVQGLTALQGLYCGGNQLTALDVQGLTALQGLDCHNNRLTAQAFTKLFDDLPQITSYYGHCALYTEKEGVSEGNNTDFTKPPELQSAFNNAKTVKKWKMYKVDAGGHYVEI